MSNEFEIKQATRSVVKALVGFYGKSGGGKTMSALLFARGLVGPSGRIVGIDTENHRMSLFADLIPGGFSVIDLGEPFSPDRYWGAIEAAEKVADVIVVDSMSHEWAGEGGILDMQEAELTRMAGADNWQKRESCKMAAWIMPKMVHKKFVNRLLRSKCHVLCCLRGEEKTTMKRNDKGKIEVEKDEFTTCIADPRFIFEMLVNLEVYAKDGEGGYCHIRKITHTGTRACLPTPTEQVAVRHGEALARWCAGGTEKPTEQPKKQPTHIQTVASLKNALWKLTMPLHNGDANKLQQFLHDENLMELDAKLADLSAEQLMTLLEKTTDHLKGAMAK